jgi:hypothetical protein
MAHHVYESTMIATGRLAVMSLAAVAAVSVVDGQSPPDSPSWRLLRASETEQIAAVKLALDQGFSPDQFELVGLLIFNKNSLTLPLLESKIEQVLRSKSPLNCFINKNVDIQRFIFAAAITISETGGEAALKEVAKLIKLDEQRFGMLVANTLDHSVSYSKSHNPFKVAYSGLALRDPAIDQRILTWAESHLSIDPEERAKSEAAARGFGPTPPPLAEKMKHLWAEAILDHYGGIPTGEQWARDPIAWGLKSPLAESLRQEVFRLALEAVEKRPAK